MILVNKSQNLFIYLFYLLYLIIIYINSSNSEAVPTVQQYLPENITDFNSLSDFKPSLRLLILLRF